MSCMIENRGGTCFTKAALDRLRKAINEKYKDDPIPSNLNKTQLLEAIRNKMKDHCKSRDGENQDLCIANTNIARKANINEKK